MREPVSECDRGSWESLKSERARVSTDGSRERRCPVPSRQCRDPPVCVGSKGVLWFWSVSAKNMVLASPGSGANLSSNLNFSAVARKDFLE